MIASEQILPLDAWERVRPVLRPLFIGAKDARRLAVGPHVTLLFENRQTVWYQIEEMIRVERLTDADAIGHEIATYNELLPAGGELSATLFIEYTDPAERDAALKRLVGLERHLFFELGERRVPATFNEAQIAPDAVSAVQFVRFALGGSARAKLAGLASRGELAVSVDHPEMRARGAISAELARTLAEDLPA